MLKRFLLTGAALTALTGFAAAQTAPADPATPPAAEVPNPGMTNPAAPGMAVDPAVKADPNLYTNITGANVVGQDDESVGRLADILIDASGQLKALVIAHGGIVGIGQTYRHYDVSELPSVSDGKITIGGLNTAALDGLPEYAYPEAETGRAATTTEAPDAGPSVATAPAESSSAAPSDALWPASYLIGARVGSEEDKASISDLRFEGNRVAAALIDRGSLGLGNKVEEVAFEDLQISGSPAEPQIARASGGAASDPNAESSTVPGGAPAPAPAPAP